MKFIDWCFKTGNDPQVPASRLLHKAAQQAEANAKRKAKKGISGLTDGDQPMVVWLRRLRRLWRNLEEANLYMEQIGQAPVLTPADELRLEEGQATLQQAKVEYDKHAAQHPAWADEFERRAMIEALNAEKEQKERTIRQCRESHMRLSKLSGEKPKDVEQLKKKLREANAKFQSAKENYYGIREENAQNADLVSAKDKADREEKAYEAYEKASAILERVSRRMEKITESVPSVSALASQIMEIELCELRIQQIEEQQRELAEGLEEDSPITFKEKRTMNTRKKTGRPRGAVTPEHQAQRWMERLPAAVLEKYTYEPETGRFIGPYGVLSPKNDVVSYNDPVTLKQRNAPKGLMMALMVLGQPVMLEPSTGADDPFRWAWAKLRMKQPRNARHIIWASDLDISDLV